MSKPELWLRAPEQEGSLRWMVVHWVEGEQHAIQFPDEQWAREKLAWFEEHPGEWCQCSECRVRRGEPA